MLNSILNSIKKLLGIDPEYKHFDQDLIMHINSVFVIINQLGVGDKAFSISGEDNTWDEFITEDMDLAIIKSYIFMKVKLIFDPPMSSAVIESMNKLIAEAEWRINVQVDPDKEENQNE